MQLRSWIKAELHKLDQDRCGFFHFFKSDLDFDVHFAEILNRLILEQFEITIQTDQIESAKKKQKSDSSKHK